MAFGTPVTWSAAELSELHYPHLERGAREQRNEWKALHSSLLASSPGCGVTEEELAWAMGVAYSRAFRCAVAVRTYAVVIPYCTWKFCVFPGLPCWRVRGVGGGCISAENYFCRCGYVLQLWCMVCAFFLCVFDVRLAVFKSASIHRSVGGEFRPVEPAEATGHNLPVIDRAQSLKRGRY